MTQRLRTSGGSSPRNAVQNVSVGGMNPPSYPFAPYTVTTATTPFCDLITMMDYVTKDARRVMSKGGIINNPYYRGEIITNLFSGSASNQQVPGTRVVYDGQTGYQFAKVDGSGDLLSVYIGPGTVSTDFTIFNTYPISGEAAAYAESVNKMLAGISAPSAQSLVTAFEGKKTVQMLLDRTRKLAEYVRTARSGRRDLMIRLLGDGNRKIAPIPRRYIVWDPNGDPIMNSKGRGVHRYGYAWKRRSQRPLDKIESVWLEGRYGWGPCVKDIIDTAKALYAEDLRGELLPRERYHSRFGKGATYESSLPINVNNVGNADWVWQRDISHTVEFRAYALYEHIQPRGLLRRLNDFGVFDIPATAYELVPLSFVLDWIVPIGDYMNALTPKFGVNVLATGVVTKRELKIDRKITSYSPLGAGTANYWPVPPCPVGASDLIIHRWKSRSVGINTPVFPPVSVNMSPKRIVDAFALLKAALIR